MQTLTEHYEEQVKRTVRNKLTKILYTRRPNKLSLYLEDLYLHYRSNISESEATYPKNEAWHRLHYQLVFLEIKFLSNHRPRPHDTPTRKTARLGFVHLDNRLYTDAKTFILAVHKGFALLNDVS